LSDIVLLPERAKELCAVIKQWRDVKNGIMMQCLVRIYIDYVYLTILILLQKESKIQKAISDFDRNEFDQYVNNVALKCVPASVSM
jgi:hypothetical protein